MIISVRFKQVCVNAVNSVGIRGQLCYLKRTALENPMMDSTAEEILLAQALTRNGPEGWYMDDSDEDQRLPHKQNPNKTCSFDKLHELGIEYWKLDADNYEHDPKLVAIRKVRDYSWMDIVTISKDALLEYDEKIKSFFQEHIHSDEESRYILDGTGYFDIRDTDDRWIRIPCGKGDMIVVPEGIYHRFTLDTNDYIKAMRLFSGTPVWTPHNRPQEEHPSRQKYINAHTAPPVASN